MSRRSQIQAWFLSLITFGLVLATIQQRVEAQIRSDSSNGANNQQAGGSSTGVSASTVPNAAAAAVPISGGASTSPTISEPVVINGITAKEVSGVVRLIRANPETEVFFIDLKDSLIIPKDSQHNKLYDLCEQSRKKGTAVKLFIDLKSRRILGHPKPPENTDSEGSD